jgi:hypothetical protein
VRALYEARLSSGPEARLRELAGTFRALTRMEHAVNIPEEYRKIVAECRTPFARDAWLRTTASLTQNPWLAHFEPISSADRHKRAANVAERWWMAAAEAMNKDAGVDVVRESVKGLVREDESVIKMVHRPHAWATFPRRAGDPEDYRKKVEAYKKGAPLPLAWRCVDRLQCVFGDGEYGDDFALEFGEYERRMLAGKHGMTEVHGDTMHGRLAHPEEGIGGKPKPEGELVTSFGMSTKIEYWDAEWWHVVIDGSDAPGFPKPNPYAPRLPLIRAKANDEVEPVLYSLMFLVPRLDDLLTMWQNWAYLSAFPTPVLEDVPNTQALPSGLEPLGDDNAPSAFTWVQGKLLETPHGKTLRFLQPPPAGQDLGRMAEIYRNLIDVAGIPSILRGDALSGQSGYLGSQMTAAASQLFKNLAAASQRQLEKCAEFAFACVDDLIGQTVYVLGAGGDGREYLGLRPEGEPTETLASVDSLGPITVKFRPVLPTDQQARAMVAKSLVTGPPEQRLDSVQHAMETWLQYENPQEIMDQIWVENAMANDPQLNKLVVDDALRQAGMLTPPAPNPAAGLVGPDGLTPLVPGLPGAVTGGLPVLPGMGMPFQPPPPPAGPGGPGGRPAGMYPGQPGGVPGGQMPGQGV